MRDYFFIALIFCSGVGLLYWDYDRTVNPDLTPDQYGVIHHPKYGEYPEKVPFIQGMTLLPGQTAYAESAIVETDLCTNGKECTLLKERQY